MQLSLLYHEPQGPKYNHFIRQCIKGPWVHFFMKINKYQLRGWRNGINVLFYTWDTYKCNYMVYALTLGWQDLLVLWWQGVEYSSPLSVMLCRLLKKTLSTGYLLYENCRPGIVTSNPRLIPPNSLLLPVGLYTGLSNAYCSQCHHFPCIVRFSFDDENLKKIISTDQREKNSVFIS